MIQELIKTVAQSQQIQSSTQREFKGQKLTSQAFRGQGTPEQGLECTKTKTMSYLLIKSFVLFRFIIVAQLSMSNRSVH